MRKAVIAALAGALAVTGVVPAGVAQTPDQVRAAFSAGYLKDPVVMADFSPPPPVSGSAASAADFEAAQRALAMQDTARFALAKQDADIFTQASTKGFSCALGVAISPANTPKTDHLMRRLIADFGRSTSAIKDKWNRARPFTVNGMPTCSPEAEANLRSNGSYPSGHAAIGYGWGLVLAQVLPARAAQLVNRGRAFADSRRVCNVHWLSDTEEGMRAATVVFAQLQSNPDYISDVAAARAELHDLEAPADCDAETSALALTN